MEIATETQALTPLFTLWHAACEAAGIALPGDKTALEQQLIKLYELLLAGNARMNLTRITDAEGFLYKHVLDSLTLLPLIPEGASVCDVGSGAGFPALPLALARPDITVTAVETVGKKATYIAETAEALGLSNRFTVLNQRAEALSMFSKISGGGKAGHTKADRLKKPQPGKYREHFDIVTARAVASLPVLLELTVPLAKEDGLILLQKATSSYRDELDASPKALRLLCADVGDILKFNAVEQLAHSVVLVIEKTDATPPLYPRTPGLPNKHPL